MRLPRQTVLDLLPPLAALALVALFTSLGLWQLERAEEKRSLRQLFEAPGEHQPLDAGKDYDLYTPLMARGRLLKGRQFLLDNIILDGRIGYYVITPLEHAPGEPVLLVNRGWLPRNGETDAIAMASAIDEPGEEVRGRAGRLPRVGIRAGEAFEDDDSWPKTANWPTLDELSEALGREVLPFVLLADAEPGTAFVRRWQPRGAGPMRHVGYAVQWFGLALAVVVTAVLLYRRRRRAP